MDEKCNYVLDVLNGAVKVCRNVETSCRYVGDSTIKLYGVYSGQYKECLKVVLLLSLASGNIPAAAILTKKLMLMEHLELN